MLLLAAACVDYGVAEVEVVDTFHVDDAVPPGDLLLVVDDSPSMAEEQERLVADIAALAEELDRREADILLAVGTTDPADTTLRTGGVLAGDDPQLVERLEEAVAAGTWGSRVEQGYAAADALLASWPELQRAETRLVVAFFSDEDDQSPGEVGSWLDALDARSGQGLEIVAVVGDEPAGCAVGASAADAGLRYLEGVAATGGLHDSICADGYAEVLTALGLDLAGWTTRFLLSEVPREETLEVHVDDLPVPPDPEDGWTWSLGDNALSFHGQAVPAPGSTVVASYEPLPGFALP